MGIYDREYVRVGPRSTSGVGAIGLWSFNTWLIVINIAVFVLDGVLASSGVLLATDAGRLPLKDAPPHELRHQVVTQLAAPSQSLPGAAARIVVDSRGDRLSGDAVAKARLTLSGQVLIDGRLYDPVGVQRTLVMSPLQTLFHFSSGKLFHLEFWRLIGFQFLHGNLTHLVFNMIGLYFFGGMVEGFLGKKRYAAFYLVCGIFGGFSYLLLNALGQFGMRVPGVLFNDIYTPLIGASAGVFGVLMAAAFIAPNAQLLVFFVLPMRLATAVYAFTLIAAINLLTGGANAGGDAAHLGGAGAGFFFIRHTHLLRDFFEVLGPSRRGKAAPAPGAPRPARPAPDDEAELDRLLAKVSREGLNSLTEGERRTLRRASETRRRRS